MYPSDLRYTKEHEWIKVEGSKGIIGITSFAQDQLGDVVFVELPEVGRTLERGESFGVVESVKTVSDLYCPVSGTVRQANEALLDRPETVNADPYGEGWIIVVEITDPAQVADLLDAAAYQAFIEEEGC